MRKLGFTLAEVLITLGIIGVIATLTLPTLMSNTAEREYSTALKKAISALTESVQMQVALENVSFDEMIDDGITKKDNNSLYAFLCNRMQTEKAVSLTSTDACAPGATDATEASCLNYGGASSVVDTAIFFRDGSAIMFTASDSVDDNQCTTAAGETVNCFQVIYDVNGIKKPNMVANCLGVKGKASKDFSFDLNGTAGSDEENTGTDDDEAATGPACTPDNFNARDQYPILLYGIGAYPGSTAAQYMMDKK